MVLHVTFTTGLVFVRQLKQGAATLCFDCNYTYSKYLDQFLTVFHATFTTGLVFMRQLKQGAATLCFNHNYTSLM